MKRIVTSTYRYKRPPRRKGAIALAVPEIVAITRKRGHKVAAPAAEADPAVGATSRHDGDKLRVEPPANDDRKSSIVTVRKRGRRFADVPDVTPEEHRRVGDLADAIWCAGSPKRVSRELPPATTGGRMARLRAAG